jgi:hypothetical protein
VTGPVVIEPERTASVRAPAAGRVREVHLDSERPALSGTTAFVLEPAQVDREPAGGLFPLSTDPHRLPQSALEPQIARTARASARLHELAGALERGRQDDWLVDRWAAQVLAGPAAAAAALASERHQDLLAERRRRRVSVPPEPEGRAWYLAGGNPSNLLNAPVADGAVLADLGAGLRASLRLEGARVGEVHPGMQVRFTLTRFGRRGFEGTVASVSPTAAADGRFVALVSLSGSTRYCLTEQALAALAELRQETVAQIPDDVLAKLSGLKDEVHSDAAAFARRLAQVLSGEELERYGATVAEYARRSPSDDPPVAGMEGEASVLVGRRPLIAAVFEKWFGR